MPAFSPQHFMQVGMRLRIPPEVIKVALAVAARITAGNQDRAVVFSLAHLAALSGVPYPRLRDWIGRYGEHPYREWMLAKTRDRRRVNKAPSRKMRRIAAPIPGLMAQQRWITQRILHTATQHQASMAFHRKADIVAAARLHCGCRWLIKMDVENFFESIYEPAVFRVFVELGYPQLLAFELTRLCTRIVPPPRNGDDERRMATRHADRGPAYARIRTAEPSEEDGDLLSLALDDKWWESRSPQRGTDGAALPLGSLPQGAPTSPLLANLAVRQLDDAIQSIATEHGLVYTRYADDIALSTDSRDFNREQATVVIGKVLRALEREGLRPHRAKTRVIPPGARKLVLGLAVDGTAPRLTREYRNKLRLHAHMLGKMAIPASEHAERLRFRSVLSMRRHIEGKIGHARRVEEAFADSIANALAAVDWTL